MAFERFDDAGLVVVVDLGDVVNSIGNAAAARRPRDGCDLELRILKKLLYDIFPALATSL